jgi:hypothetical protein
MNTSNSIIIINNFLSNAQVNNSMNAFNSSKDVEKYNGRSITKPEEIKDYRSIVKKCEDCINLKIQWWQIVKCPIGSTFNKHKDTADKKTVASFIIFLNDNFIGGHLIFKDGIVVYPKKGRAVFFDGPNLEHEVNQNLNGDRYIIAGWCCK